VIHPMRSFDDVDVRTIYTLCHPRGPKMPPRWWEAHPTLVMEVGHELVAYTSYALVMQPNVSTEGEVMIGYGIDVKPGHQGKGYGRELFEARLEVARVVGAKVFVGHALADNAVMRRMFEQHGYRPVKTIEGTPEGDLVLFMGPVK